MKRGDDSKKWGTHASDATEYAKESHCHQKAHGSTFSALAVAKPELVPKLDLDLDLDSELHLHLDAPEVLRKSTVSVLMPPEDDAPLQNVRLLCLKRLACFLERSVPRRDDAEAEAKANADKFIGLLNPGTCCYVISSVDVRILASVATGLPQEAMRMTRKSILKLAAALLRHRGDLMHEVIVYNVLFSWLKTIEDFDGGLHGEEEIGLLRMSALRMGGGKSVGNKHVYSTRYTPVMLNLELMVSPGMPRLAPDELAILKSQILAPYPACIVPESVWRSIVKSDDDLFRLDNVLRGAWDMQASMVPAAAGGCEPDTHECSVCLEVKSKRVFAMLSCERHMLCASCVLQYRKVAADSGGGPGPGLGPAESKITTRCPMRCQYRCTAIPLAAFEYQAREMRACQALSKALHLHGKEPGLLHPRPTFRVGDFVRLRVAGSVKTWVRVDAILGNGLLVVCMHTYPIVVLPDAVTGVVQSQSQTSTVVNTELSREDLHDIAANAQHSITYGRKRKAGVDADVDVDVVTDADVLHYHLCSKKSVFQKCDRALALALASATASASAWVRVSQAVERNAYSMLYSRHEPVYDTLERLHAALAPTHEILPTMLPSSCVCVETRGFQVSRQVCMRCRRIACTTCYGSVASVCAFCRACDTLGPRVLETYTVPQGGVVVH